MYRELYREGRVSVIAEQAGINDLYVINANGEGVTLRPDQMPGLSRFLFARFASPAAVASVLSQGIERLEEGHARFAELDPDVRLQIEFAKQFVKYVATL